MSGDHIDEFPHKIKVEQTLLGRFKAALVGMRAVLDEIDVMPLPEPDSDDDFLALLWVLARDGDLGTLDQIVAEVEHAIEEAGL